MIPRHVVIGLAMPVAPPGITVPGAPQITFERLNHIFGEVASSFPYRNFQSAPDGTSAEITGDTPADGLSIQPGLVQITDAIETTPERAIEKAQRVLRIAAKHLQLGHVLQIGVKWIFYAPTQSKDARTFMMEGVFSKSHDDLSALSMGGDQWAGMKYVTSSLGGNDLFILSVEPLLADETQLYIELDTRFGGHVTLDDLEGRANAGLEYVRGPVNGYLAQLGA